MLFSLASSVMRSPTNPEAAQKDLRDDVSDERAKSYSGSTLERSGASATKHMSLFSSLRRKSLQLTRQLHSCSKPIKIVITIAKTLWRGDSHFVVYLCQLARCDENYDSDFHWHWSCSNVCTLSLHVENCLFVIILPDLMYGNAFMGSQCLVDSGPVLVGD
jgi:hypothetical protein